MSEADTAVSAELARRLSKMLEEYGRPYDTAYFCIHFTDNGISGCGLGDPENVLRLVITSLEACGLAIARPLDEHMDS
jgi:hypothetical protein